MTKFCLRHWSNIDASQHWVCVRILLRKQRTLLKTKAMQLKSSIRSKYSGNSRDKTDLQPPYGGFQLIILVIFL